MTPLKLVGIAAASLLLAVRPSAEPPTFSSGSTGADGPLDISNCPGNVCVVQLPTSGVLNYTTIKVAAFRFLTFRPNLANTPAILLAQGDVDIQGVVDVSQDATAQTTGISNLNPSHWRIPGPGGFAGGGAGQPGFGPGAGNSDDSKGRWVGPLSLVPIVGGSGGRGYDDQHPGAGGGGAIVIASSGTITVGDSGAIHADGSYPGNYTAIGGLGLSSGGAIRLIANSVIIRGSLTARPGCCYANVEPPGSFGVVRVEAPTGARTFVGTSLPAAVLADVNPAVLSPAPASLSILSIGGYSVPAYSGQRYDTVDLLLPSQLPDPIPVVVSASNIPVGTPVGITFGTGNSGTVTPGVLTGTLGSSTATIQVSGLNRTQLAYLFVSATFAVPAAAEPLNPVGPDQVASVRVRSAPGAAPEFVFLRSNGTSIDAGRLPPAFVAFFRY